MLERFLLRKVAGSFYLIDMLQEGVPYHKPVLLNQSAAEIWEQWEQKKSDDEIADFLASSYSIERKAAKEDIEGFRRMIKNLMEAV